MKKTIKHTIEFAVAASALKHSIEGDFNRISVKEAKNMQTAMPPPECKDKNGILIL